MGFVSFSDRQWARKHSNANSTILAASSSVISLRGIRILPFLASTYVARFFFLNGMFEHKWVIDDVEAFFSVDSIPENEPCFVSPCVTLHGKNEILRFVDREFVVPFDEYIAPAILKYLDHPDYKSEGTDM